MTTPILTAALARPPRSMGGGGAKFSSHNYLAEAGKKPVGAPLGNRNAARRSPEDVDRQARLKALVQHTLALAHAANAAMDQARAEREALRALMAEPRHV